MTVATRMSQTIRFKFLRDKYGFLSNFAVYPMEINGKKYDTVEHYFQAVKFDNPDYQEKIRLAPNPPAAKRLGRTRSFPIKANWDTLRNDVMYDGCLAKFTQHADIRKKLLETGDATLVENSSRDSYWGDAPDGSGQNMLGKTLMNVREHLKTLDSDE